MSRLKTLLQTADPLSHEPPPPESALARVRRNVLETAPTGQARQTARKRVTRVGAIAVSVLGIVVLGVQLWHSANTTLLAAVRFEVRLAEERPTPGLIVARVDASDRVIYLHPETVVNNADIAQSWVSQDGPDRFTVAVEFLPAGADRMRQATTMHVGRPVAVLIDGNVVMAPTLRSAISDSAMITGDYTRAEAERIANGIEGR